jgi:hypothetical protein
MTRRTHVLALVTLVLTFLMVAPAAFAAEADADRWLAGIADVNGDAVPDIAVGDPAQRQMYVFSGADGTLLGTVEDPDLQEEARRKAMRDDEGDVIVGDVDRDAVPDVAVEDLSRGQVLVFSGADGTLLYTFMLPNAEADEERLPIEGEALACKERTKYVKQGKWRTLETFVGPLATGTGYFLHPAGAQIKLRCGVWPFGSDKQKQTLDGIQVKTLRMSKSCSYVLGRMQMKVQQSTYVTYQVCAP